MNFVLFLKNEYEFSGFILQIWNLSANFTQFSEGEFEFELVPFFRWACTTLVINAETSQISNTHILWAYMNQEWGGENAVLQKCSSEYFSTNFYLICTIGNIICKKALKRKNPLLPNEQNHIVEFKIVNFKGAETKTKTKYFIFIMPQR